MAIKASIQFDVFQDGKRIKGVTSVTTKNSIDGVLDRCIEIVNLDHYGLTKSDVTRQVKELSRGYWILEATKDDKHFLLTLKRL